MKKMEKIERMWRGHVCANLWYGHLCPSKHDDRHGCRLHMGAR